MDAVDLHAARAIPISFQGKGLLRNREVVDIP
jgi:hypothetical protein